MFEKIMKNLQNSIDEIKNQESNGDGKYIKKISGFQTMEEANIMRFFTENEYNSLTPQERQEYDNNSLLRDLIIKKYNIIDSVDRAASDFNGE